MKILIDALQHADDITGTDRAARNLLRELQTLDQKNDYRVICMKGYRYIPDILTAPNFRIDWLTRRRKRNPIFWVALLWRWISRIILNRPDLFFSFHNFQVPAVKYAKIITSDLDLIPLHFPGDYSKIAGVVPFFDRFASQARREQVYRRKLQHAIDLADHFMANSEFSKDDLVKTLGVDPKKITVVNLAPEERFTAPIGSEEITEVRRKYHLPPHYVLTMGSTEPRKNVRAVIEAFGNLPADLKKKYRLVVGGRAWHHITPQDILGEEADLVHFTNYVDDQDLPALYKGATVFVLASLFEGFGIPLLEAQAVGTPILSSNRTSLPEIGGRGAEYVDPEDRDAITREMAKLLQDEKRRKELVAAGRVNLRRFSWRVSAEKILRMFEEVGESD